MARIRGSTVGIVGGSIAGCATAVALARLGCAVHVFERSSGALRDRGAGIMVPPALRDDLIDGGYLPTDYPNDQLAARLWIVADGTSSGRVLWRQPGSVVANNGGVLWRSLRTGVPDDRYHDGTALAALHADARGAPGSRPVEGRADTGGIAGSIASRGEGWGGRMRQPPSPLRGAPQQRRQPGCPKRRPRPRLKGAPFGGCVPSDPRPGIVPPGCAGPQPAA